MIRSHSEHKGWFDYSKNTYVQLENGSFFGNFSYNSQCRIDAFDKNFQGIKNALKLNYFFIIFKFFFEILLVIKEKY